MSVCAYIKYGVVGPALLTVLSAASCVVDSDDAAAAADIVTVGDALPAFAVTLADGSRVAPETLAGRPALLVFFHTSCGDCRRVLPEVHAVYEPALADSGRFVCISRAEDAESVAAYWAERGLTLPYSAQPDTGVYGRFAREGIPRLYGVDATGTVRFVCDDRTAPAAAGLTAMLRTLF